MFEKQFVVLLVEDLFWSANIRNDWWCLLSQSIQLFSIVCVLQFKLISLYLNFLESPAKGIKVFLKNAIASSASLFHMFWVFSMAIKLIQTIFKMVVFVGELCDDWLLLGHLNLNLCLPCFEHSLKLEQLPWFLFNVLTKNNDFLVVCVGKSAYLIFCQSLQLSYLGLIFVPDSICLGGWCLSRPGDLFLKTPFWVCFFLLNLQDDSLPGDQLSSGLLQLYLDFIQLISCLVEIFFNDVKIGVGSLQLFLRTLQLILGFVQCISVLH